MHFELFTCKRRGGSGLWSLDGEKASDGFTRNRVILWSNGGGEEKIVEVQFSLPDMRIEADAKDFDVLLSQRKDTLAPDVKDYQAHALYLLHKSGKFTVDHLIAEAIRAYRRGHEDGSKEIRNGIKKLLHISESW